VLEAHRLRGVGIGPAWEDDVRDTGPAVSRVAVVLMEDFDSGTAS